MTTHYSSIRGDLNTGDIVLFSGKGNISTVIKMITRSEWSHVGMILNLPEYDLLTVWGSTNLTDIQDLSTGVARKGVQLVPLSDRVQKYSGEIAIRKLQGGTLTKESITNLMALRKDLRGRPYERGENELLKAAYEGPLGENKEDLSSLFCSELVAEAYQALGLLGEDTPSNEYTPVDFSDKKMSKLLGDFYLSEEIVIKRDRHLFE